MQSLHESFQERIHSNSKLESICVFSGGNRKIFWFASTLAEHFRKPSARSHFEMWPSILCQLPQALAADEQDLSILPSRGVRDLQSHSHHGSLHTKPPPCQTHPALGSADSASQSHLLGLSTHSTLQIHTFLRTRPAGRLLQIYEQKQPYRCQQRSLSRTQS